MKEVVAISTHILAGFKHLYFDESMSLSAMSTDNIGYYEDSKTFKILDLSLVVRADAVQMIAAAQSIDQILIAKIESNESAAK